MTELHTKEKRALLFAYSFRGVHSYDKSVRKEIEALHKKGLVQRFWYDRDGQFKITNKGIRHVQGSSLKNNIWTDYGA